MSFQFANSKLIPSAIAFLVLSFVQAGCQSSVTSDPNSANANGGAGGRGANGTGFELPDGSLTLPKKELTEKELPTENQHCGEHRGTTRAMADVVLVLDLSGSMNRNTSTGKTRYEAVTEALNQTLPATDSAINWGLMMYPARADIGSMIGDRVGLECTPGKMDVPVAPKNAAAVAKAYSDQRPDGYTPTAASVNIAVNYLTGLKGVNTKYIVLATDGQPNCAAGGLSVTADDDAAVAAVAAAKTAAIPTFVVGLNVVGDNLADQNAPAVLNRMAVAGGMPSNDPANKFYVANTASEMVKAMETIGRQLATCRYTLPSVPPVPQNVLVIYSNGTRQLPSDTTWGYTDNTRTTIQLYGESCERVRNGTYKEVQILFGCPGQDQLIP